MASVQKTTQTPHPNSSSLPVARPPTSIARQPRGSGQRRIRPAFLIIGLVFDLLVILAVALWAANLGAASSKASISLTPLQLNKQQVVHLTAVTETPGQNQVHARLLKAIVAPQTTTVPTTGFHQQSSVVASGNILLLNIAPFTQYVAAGSILTTKGGIQVELLTQAQIPASSGEPLVQGSATVPARALDAGVSGNIPAYALNNTQCCDNKFVNGIVAKNTQAFSGGQDAAQYPYVQQDDITNTATLLAQQTKNMEVTTLQAQIHPNEVLIEGSSCTHNTQANGKAGDRASSVTVTVTDTCSGEVYNQQDTEQITRQLFTEQETAALGSSYRIRQITMSTPKISVQDAAKGTLAIAISVSGTLMYHLNQTTLQRNLPSRITGKSPAQARDLLSRLPGVATVKISGDVGDTLPTNTSHITITVSVPPPP